ncbi:MAG: DNA-processing protein DprA [Rubricoccaceae bacterium]
MPDLFSSPPAESPSDTERRALVGLSLVPGVGPTRVRSLLARLGSAERVFRASPAALARVDGIGRQTASSILSFDDWAEVDRQFDRAQAVGARLVALHDDEMPRRLAQIYDPPPYLWVRGTFMPEDDRAVAIVGTRKVTDYGTRVAGRFAAGLAEAGVTIVSGLAYGIDIAAHRAALDAGGRTIAVLGSGVDRIYPSRHADVVRRVVEEERGAVVSEFSLGAAPDAPNFPRRNRIIAGLCVATLVAEARSTGGAMLTAAMALEQNREVFAVPAPVTSDTQGTNRLIRQGYAALVTDVSEVLDDLGVALPSARQGETTETSNSLPDDLTAIERSLLDALTSEPRPLDLVCADSGVDASQALVYLLQLEFRGLVRQLAGKQFFRA